jgi:hypothetical protein
MKMGVLAFHFISFSVPPDSTHPRQQQVSRYQGCKGQYKTFEFAIPSFRPLPSLLLEQPQLFVSEVAGAVLITRH